MNVTVVDYGIGNLLSVQRALKYNGATVNFAKSASQIRDADRLVVPGVGAFSQCMNALQTHELKESLIEHAASGKPYLGICVGMQMLLDTSNEFGEHAGLGIIAGSVNKIDLAGHRTPFIGWKSVELMGKSNHFYFVHSYEAVLKNPDNLLASYTLGSHRVTAGIRADNVIGVQFHPEKSAQDGLEFLDYFLGL